MKPALLFITVTILSTAQISVAPFNPSKLKEWVKAVDAHRPGLADEPAVSIGRWTSADLLQVVADYKGLLAEQADGRASFYQTHRAPVLVYKGRTFTLPQIETLLGLTADEIPHSDGNRTIKHAAILHTDIARLVRSRRESTGSRDLSTVLVFNDGQRTAAEPRSPHWDIARLLLDAVKPLPSTDDTVRHWYRATAAAQIRQRHFGYAASNLTRAAQVLPNDAVVFFYSGVLHENLASSTVQNMVLGLGGREQARVGALAAELGDAERLLRRAIELDPAMTEARVHLGHVLDQQGNAADAVTELTRAIAEIREPAIEYYATLFLGQAEARRGRRGAAYAAFERASVLFPLAQSPLFAASELARSEDNSPRALATLQRIMTLPPDAGQREDPWWTYDISAVRDADALLAALYGPFQAERAR